MRHSAVFIHPLPESFHSFADISVRAIFTSAERRGAAQVLIPLNNNFRRNSIWFSVLVRRDRIILTSLFLLHQWRACRPHDDGAGFRKPHSPLASRARRPCFQKTCSVSLLYIVDPWYVNIPPVDFMSVCAEKYVFKRLVSVVHTNWRGFSPRDIAL